MPLRQMRAAPGVTAVVILSLVLGIGADTAIFSLIDAVMLTWLPVKNLGELVFLSWGAPTDPLTMALAV